MMALQSKEECRSGLNVSGRGPSSQLLRLDGTALSTARYWEMLAGIPSKVYIRWYNTMALHFTIGKDPGLALGTRDP